MIVQPALDLPSELAAGIAQGFYERKGGVVRWVPGTPNGGQVVAWLREVGTEPVPTSSIGQTLGLAGAGAAQLTALGWVSAGASLLNLAATVGFGVAILLRLNKIGTQIDSVRVTIEEGFQGLEDILHGSIEADFFAKLRSAALYCSEAQMVHLADTARKERLSDARRAATDAFNSRLAHARRAVQSAGATVAAQAAEDRVRTPEPLLLAIVQLRQAIMACALRASITAQADDPGTAHQFVVQQTTDLESLAQKLGLLFLNRHGPTSEANQFDPILQMLLDYRSEEIPLPRLAAWIDRSGISGGLTPILEEYRRHNARRTENSMLPITRSVSGSWARWSTMLVDVLGVWARTEGEKVKRRLGELLQQEQENRQPAPRLAEFADQLDGVWDDLDRLHGHAEEYRFAASHNLSITAWEERLATSARRITCEGRFAVILEPVAA